MKAADLRDKSVAELNVELQDSMFSLQALKK